MTNTARMTRDEFNCYCGIMLENRQIINGMIDEALGISLPTNKESQMIKADIMKRLSEMESTPIEDERYIPEEVQEKVILNLKYNILGFTVSASCQCLCFTDWASYHKYVKGEFHNAESIFMNTPYSKRHRSTSTMSIQCYTVNDEMDTAQLVDSINHELFHLFEQNQQGYGFQIMKNQDLYGRVSSLFSKFEENSDGYLLAYALYLHFDYEQRAFVNGLYAYVNEKPLGERMMKLDELINTSPLVKRIAMIRNSLKNLKDGKVESETLNIIYGCTKYSPSQIYEIGSKTIAEISMRIAKATILMHDELNGMMSSNPGFKNQLMGGKENKYHL